MCGYISLVSWLSSYALREEVEEEEEKFSSMYVIAS